MKKQNLKKLLSIFVVLVLMCSLVLFTACGTDDEDKEIPESDKIVLPVPNGNFQYTTSDTYPKVPESWSASIGGIGSSAAPSGSDIVTAGVVNVSEKSWDKNKKNWDKLNNPGKPSGSKDDNILMIYGREHTSYSYSSANFNIKEGGYYKLSFWIKTAGMSGATEDSDFGATIGISANTYAGFYDIRANDWTQYEIYIEGGLNGSQSLKLEVSLGDGDKNSSRLTQGAVFFDDVNLEEVTENDYDSAVIDADTDKASMLLPNQDFEHFDIYNSLPYPYGYSSVKGGESGNWAPSGKGLNRGVVSNTTEYWESEAGKSIFNYTDDYILDAAVGKPYEDADDYSLMIRNHEDSAFGYESNRKIVVERGTSYRFSMWVKTVDNKNSNANATIVLNGPEELKVENINTGGEWKEVVFFLRGNQNYNVEYTIEMWLGTGGKSDETNHSSGWAFFDSISMIENTDPAKAWDSHETYSSNANNLYGSAVKEDSTSSSNSIVNGNFTSNTDGQPDSWTGLANPDSDVISAPDSITTQVVDTNNDEAAYWDAIGTANPGLPFPLLSLGSNPLPVYDALMIHHAQSATYRFTTNDKTKILANHYYRVSVWIKTVDVQASSGIYVNLTTTDEDGERSVLSSFAAINTAELEDSRNNDWQEVVFLIEGDYLKEKDVSLEIQFGTGGKFNTDTRATGYAFMSNANMVPVTSKQYSSESSSNDVKKYSFATSSSGSGSWNNAGFNILDNTKSEVDENGNLIKPGYPKSWTPSEEEQEYTNAGIIDIENETLLSNLNLNKTDILSNDTSWLFNGAPNILMIQAQEAATAFSYKSASKSLSANSYYKVSVSAKALGVDTWGQVSLISESPSSKVDEKQVFTVTPQDNNNMDGWVEYIFYIKVGLNSANIRLEFSLGDKDATPAPPEADKDGNIPDDPDANKRSTGTILFDQVHFEKIEGDSAEIRYEATKEELIDGHYEYSPEFELYHVSFSTDSFDTPEVADSDNLSTPKGWNGSYAKNADTSNKETDKPTSLYGTANINNSDFNKIFGKDENDIVTGQAIKDLIGDGTLDANTQIGEQLLIIHNQESTGYNYSSANFTFAKDKYYEISIWAKVNGTTEDTARLRLSVTKDETRTLNINSTEWQKFTFYVQTSDTTALGSVKMNLELGWYDASAEKTHFTTGTVLFDNFSIKDIDEDQFPTEDTEENKSYTDIFVYEDSDDGDTGTEDDDKDEDTNPIDWQTLSWAIPTIIIAVILLIVVIAFFFKKYNKGNKGGKNNQGKKFNNKDSDSFKHTKAKTTAKKKIHPFND